MRPVNITLPYRNFQQCSTSIRPQKNNGKRPDSDSVAIGWNGVLIRIPCMPLPSVILTSMVLAIFWPRQCIYGLLDFFVCVLKFIKVKVKWYTFGVSNSAIPISIAHLNRSQCPKERIVHIEAKAFPSGKAKHAGKSWKFPSFVRYVGKFT